MIKASLDIGLLLASLLFYADFDRSFDAVYSVGKGKALIETDRYEPFITSGNGGRFGEAAAFIYGDMRETIWTRDVVRYPARGNFPYAPEAFDGTIGMWLQVDMEALKERSLIWLDPVHLLSRNDRKKGKIWMDFVTAELPDTPIFRFGATADRDGSGRQDNREMDHVIIIPNIDFSGKDWHHVVGTWKNLNSTGNKSILQLYFDGRLAGELTGFDHALDWQIDDWEIRIGLGFNGKIDDFFILDSYLPQKEITEIYNAGKPLGELLDLRKE
jgi:hypothetical protein